MSAQLRNAKVKDDEDAVRSRRQARLVGRDDIESRPLVKAWEYLAPIPTRFPVLVTERAVFVPQAEGRVVALRPGTGELLWETPPGGEITAPLAAGPSEVYVATERATEAGKEGILRLLDAATGITKWTVTLPAPVVFAPALAGETVVLSLSNGSLTALKSSDGGKVWDSPLGGRLHLADGRLFVGGAGKLIAVDPKTGAKIWEFERTDVAFGTPVADEKRVYVGASNGRVHALDVNTGKEAWNRRTGAAVVAAPVVIADRILVGSYDNFLYSLRAKNGSQVWRQQMSGRLTAPPVAFGDGTLAVSSFDGSEVTVFDVRDGDVTARLVLENNRILAGIGSLGDVLLVPSEKGTVAAHLNAIRDSKPGRKDDKPKKDGKGRKG